MNISKKYFNLIEITMAVAIVGIGIAGVVAMLPPAIEANKTADFNNYTGSVVENLAAFVEFQLKKDWNTFSGGLTTSKGTPAYETDTDNWTTITNFPGIYITTQSNIYGIRSSDGSVAAHVQMWKSSAPESIYYDGSAVSNVSTSDRIRVTIELSWPIVKNYADREKREFVYEFNKP